MEYFEWDLSKVLSQGELNFLDYFDNKSSLQNLMWSSTTNSDSKRFSSEPYVVKYNKTLIAKGSSQNLMRSSTTRIVSHYMTLFLVQNHERVRYRNGL
jgi:hypothetical protein